MSKSLTRQQAINAFCKECIYCPQDAGTWRMQAQECTAKRCPLYEHRPLPTVRSTPTESTS